MALEILLIPLAALLAPILGALLRRWVSIPLVALISASLHTSGQFAVRVVIALLAALVTLALTLGVDFLLGAFCAGMLTVLLYPLLALAVSNTQKVDR